MIDIFIIIVLLTLFGLSHTILASNKIKNKLVDTIGNRIAFYRIFYNVSSILILFAIYEISPKPSGLLYDLLFPYDIIILGIQFLSLAGFFWTLFYFDGLEFLGIRQVIRYVNGNYNVNCLDEKKTFVTEGPFKYTRHPLYFFSVIFLLARSSMTEFYFIMILCFIVYFYVGAKYEEKKLLIEFNDKYRDYQKSVPFLIPIKFRKNF